MPAVKKSYIVEEVRKLQMNEQISKGKRLDGRGLLDYRPIKIETNVIEKANGSARVFIGNSQVVAGIKVQIGTPFPDTPDKGLLIVNTELLPLSSAQAEPGPPSEDAIELSRVVDRGVRESKMVDLSTLAIIPGKKVRAIFADVAVLNDDGNLIDTVSCAVVSALLTTKIPKLEVSDDDEIIEKETMVSLTVSDIPVPTTFAKIGESMFVDPDFEEESAMDARLTLTTTKSGTICAGQKGLPSGLTIEQVKHVAANSVIKGEEIRKIIKKAVSENGKKT